MDAEDWGSTTQPPKGGSSLTVFLIDAQRSFGEALGLAIEAERDLQFLGWAETPQASRQHLEGRRPSVVIMDEGVAKPATQGISFIRSICPDAKIVALSANPTLSDRLEAEAVGAIAVLSKHASVAEILATIRKFGVGETSLTVPSPSPEPGDEAVRIVRQLTPRELQVLELLGTGLDPRGIAKELQITISTARDYVQRLLTKFGAHTQLEVVIKASRLGLISL